MKYLKKFEQTPEYTEYMSGGGVRPNVSLVTEDMQVYYNPAPFFCKLKLNDNTIVELEGSGELTRAMVSNQYKNTLVNAEIGELCTSIDNYAFSRCSSLINITIPSSIISIGEGAFYSCSSLTSVTIPSGVTSISDRTFDSCTSLTSVTIPNSVTSIGNGVFMSCTSLTNVTIGSGIISIGAGVFNTNTNLLTITSHIMNAPSVNPGTFNVGSFGGTLYVPIGSSGYETWMNDQGNLGLYNWTKVEQ